jgi:hypothetical protein
MLTKDFSLPLAEYQFPHPARPCCAHGDRPAIALVTFDRTQHYALCEPCLRDAGRDPNAEAELLCEARSSQPPTLDATAEA